MTEDARFEDGAERPLRLRAETSDDLAVISALLQDAIVQTADTAWMPRRRRFTALVNRFRWEDAPAARRQDRPVERVRALVSIENALEVRANGIDPRDRALVAVLLALGFEPGAEGAGTLRLVLSGDGEIAVEVEALEVTLTDVTRPYGAPSGRTPSHPE
jgi:hypothetical protein